jgi:uncharacterized protein (DUF362 family)/Pyruvate/2-oxoacid:ferredoxin oxidoreductase delta subunit
MKTKISLIPCSSYNPALVLEATRKAVEALGGISHFIRPQSRVLVKPNILMAIEPEKGITTHPLVVRAVIKILKEINCRIIVGDGPSVWGNQIENIGQVYSATGVKKVCEEEGVPLIEFSKRRWIKKFPLAAVLDECDYLVNVPKFKTHGLTFLTGAVKNLFGLVPGTYKTELHKKFFDKEDFSAMLVDILQETKPALTIVDGIVAMEGDGPGTSGKLRDLNLLLAGADAVALDSVMALIMGLKPLDVPTTREAAKRGLGKADIDSIEILGIKLEEVRGRPFLLPAASVIKKIPQPVVKLAAKLIRYYPVVDRNRCTACEACVKACPEKIIRMKKRGQTPFKGRIVIEYSKCIACFCCQECCPSSAIKIKKSILAKLIGL